MSTGGEQTVSGTQTPDINSNSLESHTGALEKECNKCFLILPLSEFYKDKSKNNPHRGECKECTKKQSRERWAKGLNRPSPELARERTRRYTEKKQKDPVWLEKRRQQAKKYRTKGRDKARLEALRQTNDPDRVNIDAWSKYVSQFMTERGFTQAQAADFFGVRVGTVQGWIYRRIRPPYKTEAEQMLRKIHNQPRRMNARELQQMEKQDLVTLPDGTRVKRYLETGH